MADRSEGAGSTRCRVAGQTRWSRRRAGLSEPSHGLERFRAKWIPVRVKKTRQNKNLEPGSDSITTGKAPGGAPTRKRRWAGAPAEQLTRRPGHGRLAGRALLRQQRVSAVPIGRGWGLLKRANPRRVKIVERLKAMGVVGHAATLDRRQSAVPVAATIAGQHLDGQVAQPLKAAGLRDVLAPGDRVDDLG